MTKMKFKYKNNRYLYLGGREFRIFSENGGSLFYVRDEKIVDVLLSYLKKDNI